MGKLLGLILFLVIITSSVNAAILINDDFNSKYNVGDRVVLKFSVSNDESVSDFLETYLNCDSDKVLIDKRYIFLENEKKSFLLEFPLRERGECRFEIGFFGEKKYSDKFDISDEIKINYFLSGKYFLPGEKINIYGNVTKFNGEKYSGIIDLKINGLTEKSFSVDDGSFDFEYELKDNSLVGEYVVTLTVDEKDSALKRINYGKVSDSIFVNSIPKVIKIEGLSEIKPPFNSSFKAVVLDQSGEKMSNETILIRFSDVNSFVWFQEEVYSGENFSIDFNSDFPRGASYLSAEKGSIREMFPVYIKENKEIFTEVLVDSIRFTNIGNVFYDGTIKYELFSENESFENFLNLSLDLGESFTQKLEYSGVYNITSSGKTFSGIYLTGAAILVDGKLDYRSLIVGLSFMIFLVIFYFYVRDKRKRVDKESKKGFDYTEIQERVPGATQRIKRHAKESEIKVRKEKLIVKEKEKNVEDIKKNVFMVFLKSEKGISEYESIVSNFGFTLNKVDASRGYVLFYQSREISPEYKVYNLARALNKFSKSRDDNLTLVLNKGVFEKRLSILKKFALFNQELLKIFPGKTMIGDKIMSKINVTVLREEKIVEVFGRKIRIWVM